MASGTMPLRSEQDIVSARQAVRKWCVELGFSLVDQTKMVTAASELARNTLIYGGGGQMEWSHDPPPGRRALTLTFADEGPGIPDLDLALTDRWTSGSGLGLGLSGARRLVQEFDIATTPGAGTRVTICRWK